MRLFFVSVEPFGGHRSRYFLYIFLYFFVKENGTEYRTFNYQDQDFKVEGWPQIGGWPLVEAWLPICGWPLVEGQPPNWWLATCRRLAPNWWLASCRRPAPYWWLAT
jgi:hypothetical protein